MPSSFLLLHFIILTPRFYSHTLSHYLLILIIFALSSLSYSYYRITYSYFLHYSVVFFYYYCSFYLLFPSPKNISKSATTFFSQLKKKNATMNHKQEMNPNNPNQQYFPQNQIQNNKNDLIEIAPFFLHGSYKNNKNGKKN